MTVSVIRSEFGNCAAITNAYEQLNDLAAKTSDLIALHQNSGSEWDTLQRIVDEDPELLNRYPNLQNVSVVQSLDDLEPGDTVFIGFHGLTANQKQQLRDNDVEIVRDAKCPFIERFDSRAETLAKEGYNLYVVGKPESHHCKEATRFAEKHGRDCTIIESTVDVDQISADEEAEEILIGQVTGNTERWQAVVAAIEECGLPIETEDTYCKDSYSRQATASEMAEEYDVVVMVDDGGGAGYSAYEVATSINDRVHRVESPEDVRSEWFEEGETVGVMGGILVPTWELDAIVDRISQSAVVSSSSANA